MGKRKRRGDEKKAPAGKIIFDVLLQLEILVEKVQIFVGRRIWMIGSW